MLPNLCISFHLYIPAVFLSFSFSLRGFASSFRAVWFVSPETGVTYSQIQTGPIFKMSCHDVGVSEERILG